MKKRDKSKWHKRTHCKVCKGYKTKGGIRFWIFKITQWKKECRCLHYECGIKTIVDEKKKQEILNKGKENKT